MAPSGCGPLCGLSCFHLSAAYCNVFCNCDSPGSTTNQYVLCVLVLLRLSHFALQATLYSRVRFGSLIEKSSQRLRSIRRSRVTRISSHRCVLRTCQTQAEETIRPHTCPAKSPWRADRRRNKRIEQIALLHRHRWQTLH